MSARRISALAIALTAVALAGCGGSDDDSSSSSASLPTTAQAAAGGAAGKVAIADFKYAPATVTVDAGAPLTFTNRDSAEHTATSDASGAFDTGALRQGGSKPVRLSKPGRYAYHCDFHPFMHGVVVVR